MAFLNALFTAMLDNNLVFAQLIGMVGVMLIAERPRRAMPFAAKLACCVLASGVLGSLLYAGYLAPWGVGYLAPVAFALIGFAVAAAMACVHAFGKPADVRAAALREAGLIAVNVVLVAAPMDNALAVDGATATLEGMLGTCVGAAAGVWLAVVLYSSVRARVDENGLVPHAMRGLPISLVTASLMALAFTCVAGIAGGLFV